MFAAPDDVQRRLLMACQPPTELVHPARGCRIVVGIDQAAPLRLHEAFLQPPRRSLVHRPEQQVLAGTQGGDGIDDLRRSLGQRMHVDGIGDGHAVELQLSAQQVAQDRGGQARGQIASLVGQREVAGHDHACARFQRRPKRDQLPLCELGGRPPDQRQLVVRIGRRVAGAREVLGRRRNALPLQAADGRRREPSNGLGIVAETANPERRIGRVAGHVAHGQVVHVDAEGPQLACHRPGDAFCQRLIAGRAERHRPRERRRPIAQADQLATLLVGGDQQGWCCDRPCLLDRRREPADLGRIDHIVEAEQRDAGHALFADPPRRRARQLTAGEGDHEPRQGHLTEPARIPRTNARWSARNTSSGTIIVRKAPAVSRCQAPP